MSVKAPLPFRPVLRKRMVFQSMQDSEQTREQHEGPEAGDEDHSMSDNCICDLQLLDNHPKLRSQSSAESPSDNHDETTEALTLDKSYLSELGHQEASRRSDHEKNDAKDDANVSSGNSLHLPPALETFECALKLELRHASKSCSLRMHSQHHSLCSASSKHLAAYAVKQPSPLHNSILAETESEDGEWRDEEDEGHMGVEGSVHMSVGDNDNNSNLAPNCCHNRHRFRVSEDDCAKRTSNRRLTTILPAHRADPATSRSDSSEMADSELRTSLHADLRKIWLVQTDISRLVADRDLEGLFTARKEQADLSFQYRTLRVREDMASSDARTMISWYQLLAAIGNKQHTTFATAPPCRIYPPGDIQIRQAHKDLIDKIDAGLAHLGGEGNSPINLRLPLPPTDQSKAFDCRDIGTWTVTTAPAPAGPTIDDAGHSVLHYVIYTSHNLINPEAWSAEDLADIQKFGFGGFLGFRGTLAIGMEAGRGHTGMLGVRDIEMAIKTRFDIGKYKICWIVDPVCDKRPHGLFQADIWIAEKKMPDHTQMIKLWNYMKMLNEEGSEGKI